MPVLALVALALVRSGDKPPRLLAAFGVIAGIFGAFLLVRSMIPDERIWPNSEVARRTAWLRRHLTQKPDWETRPVLMLAGSSATNYGIDPVLLEQELAKMGRPATVLSFCMPGNNHHERIYMLESFLRGLKPEDREKLAKAQVYFFGEVFDAYDFNPLYRIEKEAFTERAMLFLNPANALRAWQAYGQLLAQEPTAPRWSMAWLLSEHVLMNRFAVGALSSMRAASHPKRTPPFFPLEGVKASFQFDEALEGMKAAVPPPDGPAPPPQGRVCLEHTRAAMNGYVDRHGYYCLPTLEGQRAAYESQFAANASPEEPVLGPISAEEMQPLLQPGFWFDGVHPTGEGAAHFTRWLAVKIAQVLPAR